jgi:hypothetical protein
MRKGRPGLPKGPGKLVRCSAESWLAPVVVAAALACAVLLAPQRGGAWRAAPVLEQTDGAGGESLAALEQQRSRLESFLAQAKSRPAAAPALQAAGTTVMNGAQTSNAGTQQGVHEHAAAHGKPCGKLCQTRKMILQARGRIDSQAHLELQQLAVLPCPCPRAPAPCSPRNSASVTLCYSRVARLSVSKPCRCLAVRVRQDAEQASTL